MSAISTEDYIDWHDAFENGAYVPDVKALPEQWARESLALREQLASDGRLDADIAYGNDVRQTLDIARPAGESRGLVVIVHGGYWHKFDKNDWTYLAQGCLVHGWSVAVPSYRLTPHVAISQITQDMTKAITLAAQRVDGPVRLTGHSAGGHLVARMACGDTELPDSVRQRLAQVLPVSGLFDLRPLMAHPMNESLLLNASEAASESPALHSPRSGTPLTLWVGAEERPEFLRQTRLLCERWQAHLPDISATYEPGKNHFSVVDGLADAESPLVRCLLQ